MASDVYRLRDPTPASDRDALGIVLITVSPSHAILYTPKQLGHALGWTR